MAPPIAPALLDLAALQPAVTRMSAADTLMVGRTAAGYRIYFTVDDDAAINRALIGCGATLVSAPEGHSHGNRTWDETRLELRGDPIVVATHPRHVVTLEDRLAETADRVSAGETPREVAAKPLRAVR